MVLFFSGAVAGIITWLTILLFKHIFKTGRQIRRSIFIVIVTAIMAICGLVIGLINSSKTLIIIFILSFAIWGVMISFIVSLVLYRKKTRS